MIRKAEHATKFATLALLLGAADPVQAQSCTLPQASQWRKVDLVNAGSPAKLDRPDHMAILPDGRVLITEMWSGRIKLFTPGSGLSEAGTVTAYNDIVENGILGIAVPPDFAAGNWVYLFYSRKLPGNPYAAGDNNISPHELVLVRYTLAGGKLTAPKEILTVPRQTARHAGGGMTFNPATGDLFISTGDDTYPIADQARWGGRNENSYWLNSLRTSANTNDLRGKVLRIRPIAFPDGQTPSPGIGTTYQIPAGNLFPPGTARTRPEIYTMGHRNPYRFKIDPVSGIGLVGEVGPDAGDDSPTRGRMGHDEFNLIEKPGNYGWPFVIADNQPYIATGGEPYPVGTRFDPAALKNTSKMNTGLEDLPPAIPALAFYNQQGTQGGLNASFGSGSETAISGPYYRYDPGLQSDVKLPAYFHGKFIVGDWSRGRIWALEMNRDHRLAKVDQVTTSTKVIDIEMGPKGELYILEFGNTSGYLGSNNTGRLYKMEYTGPQYAVSQCPQYVFPPAVPTGLAAGRSRGLGKESRLLDLAFGRRIHAPAGKGKGVVFTLSGSKIWEGPVQGGFLSVPDAIPASLYLVRFL